MRSNILLKLTLVYLFCFLFLSCYDNKSKSKSDTTQKEKMDIMSEQSKSLGKKLLQKGYSLLFRDVGHKKNLDLIWDEAGQRTFEQLVDDTEAPLMARFLASEVLLKKDLTYLSRSDLSKLTQIYKEALLKDFTGKASDWGFFRGNNDVGSVGGMFVIFGEIAIPELIKLLDNDTEVSYSDEVDVDVVMGKNYIRRVRIKDFAALYISKIRNIPFNFDPILEERDKEISRLRSFIINR